ncbi:hypothetical protein [Gemmata sp.]|uniref:hypothetical protein n=1 Tax=Gemmata sp. TaxID=1914242 RepID=UPI003F72B097
MPSHSLVRWRTDRVTRLDRIEAQNLALSVAVPPDPDLIDENLRGFVMLLAAHFQGFCRDLHSECVQAVANAVPAPMLYMFQTLCELGRELSGTNAKYTSIKADFERFDFDLTDALTTDPAVAPAVLVANQAHISRIDHLNKWRNYAAHHNATPPAVGGPFALPTVLLWKSACHELAAELDRVMYNQLVKLTGVAPW